MTADASSDSPAARPSTPGVTPDRIQGLEQVKEELARSIVADIRALWADLPRGASGGQVAAGGRLAEQPVGGAGLPLKARASLVSRDSRYQFGVAMASMSAIPILAFVYIMTRALHLDASVFQAALVVVPTVVVLVILGMILLVRHTREIDRLRQYLEVMSRGGMPTAALEVSSTDLAAIEQNLSEVVKQSDERIRAVELQSRALLQTAQQRVMSETIGAACHHIGQPATVIKGYLELMRRKETSPELRAMIDECLAAADDLSHVLSRLHGLAQYRTEPYRPSSDGEGLRSDERILKI